MVKMICFSNGITRVFVCLFLLYLDPNSTVLCDAANELKSTLAPKICKVPMLSSPHMNNTYKCIKNIEDESKSCVSNGTVFELTVIKINCDPGYSVNGKDELVSVCYDNEWVPPIKECIISHPPVDCGRLPKNERDSQTSGMPWDVTVLRSDKQTKMVCLGTIITSRVILTSEHCLLASVFDQYDHKSMSRRNPLDPAMFEVVHVNDLVYQINSTWWSRVKYFTSEFVNIFKKTKFSTPLKIEEFRYFKHGNQDESLYHDPLIVIMEKEIKFDSHVYPACVQWETPKRLNITTGIAKIEEFRYFKHGNQDESLFHDVLIVIMEKEIKFDSHVYPACVQWRNPERLNNTTGIAKVEQFSTAAHQFGFRNKDYSFMSHDACQENPTYPYFVFNWAGLLRSTDDAPNTDRHDIKLFMKPKPTALHEGKLFCLEVKQNESITSQTLVGSGVMIKTDRRYFIRGIAGPRLLRYQSNDDAAFKDFMNTIRNVANISFQHFSKNISDANGSFDPEFVQEAVFVFNYNFASILRNHLKPVGELLTNHPEKLLGVTDVADYVDWIKHVVAEVDPYYILGL
ncbi:uncharacterized protein LOC135839479 isoform X3 [Planococcus citri]|uniref:uncharacterized protein LOC135839479 isoform X3 n=1 Tax=Planococcus citri TaxID=170843 RepID=UPI0031F97C6A